MARPDRSLLPPGLLVVVVEANALEGAASGTPPLSDVAQVLPSAVPLPVVHLAALLSVVAHRVGPAPRCYDGKLV